MGEVGPRPKVGMVPKRYTGWNLWAYDTIIPKPNSINPEPGDRKKELERDIGLGNGPIEHHMDENIRRAMRVRGALEWACDFYAH